MFVFCARALQTQDGNSGAIAAVSEWEKTPLVTLRYYRGGHGPENVISQVLHVNDAWRLADMFAQVYNAFPAKETWKPRPL